MKAPISVDSQPKTILMFFCKEYHAIQHPKKLLIVNEIGNVLGLLILNQSALGALKNFMDAAKFCLLISNRQGCHQNVLLVRKGARGGG